MQIQIDPSNSHKAVLEEVVDSACVVKLTLPDSIVWGEINHIKAYDNIFMMHDLYYTQTITFLSSKGEYINHLDKRGKGPGEYVNFESFTYNGQDSILMINDRNNKYIAYSFPELSVLESISEMTPITNFEFLDRENLLIISDQDLAANKYRGFNMYSYKNKRYSKLNIEGIPASVELSYPNTITRNGDSLLYAYPHEISTVYSITKERVNPIFSVSFGEYAIPSKYWNYKEAQEFEKSLEKGSKATWIQNVIMDPNKICFGYVFKEPKNIHMVSYNRNENTSKIYSSISLTPNGPQLPSPLGTYNGFYIVLLEDEIVEDYKLMKIDKTKYPMASSLINSLGVADRSAILLYKLKS